MTDTDPVPASDRGRALRARSVRSTALVLVLLAFAALLYGLTLVRLIG